VKLHFLAIGVLQLALGTAQACRFAQDAPPAQWFEWSSALFAADVTGIELDRQKSADVISVRVVETFKGPERAAAASLRVPSRMWSSCYLERPAVGAHVLVALNPNGDTLLVPLTPAYGERLRQLRGKHAPPVSTAPAPVGEAPAPARSAPQSGEKPFFY
jgi:hypothetical protein